MQYIVVVEAKSLPGYSVVEVREKLCRLLKTSTANGARFCNGKPVLLKKGLDLATAKRYETAIARCGASTAILPMESAIAIPIPSPEMARCPHCHYRARSEDDPLLIGAGGLGECPQCGIIVQKYPRVSRTGTPQPSSDPDIPAQESAPRVPEDERVNLSETTDTAYGVASRRQRVNAGLYTLFYGLVLFSIISLIVISYLAWSAAATIRNDPSQVHALVLSAFLDIQRSTYMITFLLVVLYLLIFVPERKGRTWGQMQFGLHVFNDQGSSDISVKAFWLRLLGQAVSILFLGKLPRQWAASSDAKTMADVLSGTTLMANPQNQRSIGRGFIGFALIGSFIMLGFQGIEYTWLMRVRYKKPHVRVLSPEEIRQIQDQKAAREAALEKMVLQRLDTACRQGDRSPCETLKDMKPVK